jgi:WD40 repeat protein
MRAPLIFIGVATIALAMPVAGHSAIIGIEWNGDVFAIDETTGGGALVGSSGYIQTNALARNSTGTLYSEGDTSSALITIDPVTGAGTLASPLTQVFGGYRAFAFSPGDVLYANGNSGGANNELYTIDVSTGAVTLVGYIPFPGVQALTFSPAGVLYGWDAGGAGLITIDPSTANAADVNPGVGGSFDIQTLAFSPDGVLYGANDSLFTIDLTSGAQTLVGNGPYTDIRGMEFVPEPSTGLLVFAGLLGIAVRRRVLHPPRPWG